MSKWRAAHARRDIVRTIARSDDARDAQEAAGAERRWTREDLVTLECRGGGPMVIALERGDRGAERLLIEHHRIGGPPIFMRIALKHLPMLRAAIDLIEGREP